MTLLKVPSGSLEALLAEPAERSDRAPVALVCHPHPVYGGTMHTKVVHTVSKSLEEAGIANLRFNFRGVGASTGSFDNGVGERDDALFALDHLNALFPEAPMLVVGFSFGSWIGMTVGADDPRVEGLIGLAPPVSRYDFSAVTPSEKPKLILQGEEDTLAPLEDCETFYESLAPPKSICLFQNTGHLFLESLSRVRSILTTSMQNWPPSGQRVRLKPDTAR